MIQLIGVMMAFYIFARLAEMFENKKLSKGSMEAILQRLTKVDDLPEQ